MLEMLFAREGWFEGLTVAERDATEMCRNSNKPQAETSAKRTSPYLVTVFSFLASDCISFFGCNMIFFCVGFHFEHKTHTHIVSSTSTGKPQPQHGFGMSSWAQKYLVNFGTMST